MFLELVILSSAVCSALGAQHGLNEAVFDLSYHYDNATPHWPRAAGFKFVKIIAQVDESANWYASNDFCVGEHGGTHLDAPYHFNRDGWKVADVPFSKLINKGYVLDVEALGDGETTANTTLQPRHIREFERKLFGDAGRLPADSILLIRFNWARNYGTKEYYNLRTNDDGQISLSFPGVGAEAARLLVERQVAGVGVDTASVDPGSSTNFEAHRILSKANTFNMENVNITADLVRYNHRMVVYAMPMKILGGTGAPCRILAVVPKNC